MCPYFCKYLSVVMYKKFRNVPSFKDFPPICPYFLGFRVGKYGKHWRVEVTMSSVERQKGVQRCYVENQKGAITVQSLLQ